MKNLPAWKLCKSASLQRNFYQQSFSSFYQMLQHERRDAKKTILIEDKTQKLPYISKSVLENILDIKIEKVYPYKLNGRFFSLVRLDDYSQLIDKHHSHHKSIKARYLLLSSLESTKEVKLGQVPEYMHNVIQIRNSWASLLDNNEKFDSEQFIDKLAESVILNEFECKLRFYFINQLEELLCTSKLSDFTIIPFGSSVNGCGWNQSDLDVSIVSKRSLHLASSFSHEESDGKDINSREEGKRILKALSQSMSSYIPGIRNIYPILNARVPIIKFDSVYTGLACDVSYQTNIHDSGVDIAQVLFRYCQIDERVVKLMVLIKIWALKQGITRPTTPGPYLTNFCLMLMVIHYLQIRKPDPVLPPISHLDIIKLQPSFFTDEFIGNTNSWTTFDERSSPATLLTEFFAHISTFNYDQYGFNVVDGMVVQKPFDDPIYIENPLQRDLNVSRNVSKTEMFKLIYTARLSYMSLKKGEEIAKIFVPFSKNSLNVQDLLKDD